MNKFEIIEKLVSDYRAELSCLSEKELHIQWEAMKQVKGLKDEEWGRLRDGLNKVVQGA